MAADRTAPDLLAAAVRHHQAGRAKEAEALYRQVLAAEPDHLAAGVNLGHLLLAAGRPDEAIACFDRVLDLAPAQPDALFGRGGAHAALERFDRAEADFRALLADRPGHAAALNRLGGVLIRQARMAEAIDLLEGAHERHPDNADLLANLASAYEAQSDLEAAAKAARNAQKLRPDAPGPRLLLARLDLRSGRLTEARRGLEDVLALPLDDQRRCEALFELGQVLDRMGDAEAAYRAFLEANALHAASPAARRFDGARFLGRVAANRAVFTERAPARMPRTPRAAQRDGERPPVFFVGFPRSGTTLVERALAAHPEIVTTEERSPLTPAVRHLIGGGAPSAAAELPGESQLAEARTLFRERTTAIVGPLVGRLLVDKLPLNLVDLGYANLLFPEARALVALRDPRDVCLSCFMQRFQLNDSMINFSSLERTVETYAAVMGLWLAYRDSLSLAWREFRYEDLVGDFEAVLRDLLAFLGLKWDEAVAHYRERAEARTVATPSYRQVTREIYRDSIGRWRAYRKVMAPYLPRLAPFVEAFGYPQD
jgi:tetratricopeptide (TPR) repeat protein